MIKSLSFVSIFLFFLHSLSCATVSKSRTYTLFADQNNFHVVFTSNGDIVSMRHGFPLVESTMIASPFFTSNSLPLFEMRAAGSTFIDSCIKSVPVHLLRSETDSTIKMQFTSEAFIDNITFEKSYILHKKSFIIDFSLQFSGDSADIITARNSFQLIFHYPLNSDDNFSLVNIDKKSSKLVYYRNDTSGSISDNSWTGLRNRYWTILLTSRNSQQYFFEKSKVLISYVQNNDNFNLKMYCGPVIYQELHKAGSECTKLLYPLWFWMRWLSIGFLLLFNFILKLSNNVVLSIVMLSVFVKILIAPLFKLANKWQKKVNELNSILRPGLDEIKSKYKGEEQTKQTLALYMELGISPLYSLKSLLSAAIQIPLFFAAYHMLSEHIALSNISFLWINDLSSPDKIATLPFSIPLIGNEVNLLPFVMTSFTFASSWIHKDRSLSAQLQKKQQNNLYLMAGLFFILLYRSPAGIVIYWTMNNVLAFLSTFFEAYIFKKDSRKKSAVKTEKECCSKSQGQPVS